MAKTHGPFEDLADIKRTDSDFHDDVEELAERDGADAMSRRAFYLLIGIILAWGLAVTVGALHATRASPANPAAIAAVALVGALAGFAFARIDSAVLSFIGFNLIAAAAGAGFGLLGELIEPGSGADLTVTVAFAAIAATMTVGWGMLFPGLYHGFWGSLIAAALSVGGVALIAAITPGWHVARMEYAFASVASLYVGVNLWRLGDVPATLDNAVDACVALYVDAVFVVSMLVGMFRRDKDD